MKWGFICLGLLFSIFCSDAFAQTLNNPYLWEGIGQAEKKAIDTVASAPEDALNKVNETAAGPLNISASDPELKADIAEDFSESITNLQNQVIAGGNVAGFASRAIQNIEDLEKKIKENDKTKNNKSNQSSQITNLLNSEPPISEELKFLVLTEGKNAIADLNTIIELFGSLPFTTPYDPKSASQTIRDAKGAEANVELPTQTVVAIWQLATAEHFAQALQTNSAIEFQKGLEVIKVTLWQLRSRSDGFVYSVHLAPMSCPDKDLKLLPLASLAFTECELRQGRPLNALVDFLGAPLPLRNYMKNGLKRAGGQFVISDGVKAILPDDGPKKQKNNPNQDNNKKGQEILDEVGEELPPSLDTEPTYIIAPPSPFPGEIPADPRSEWPESQD